MAFFQHNGLKLYYEVHGKGAPLLLINGLAGDTRQWEMLIGHLKKDFEIICYDMRCTGKSDKPEEEFTIRDLSNEALALLEHLHITKTSVLGFSMGGAVAMDLSIERPKVVRKLFLISSTPSMRHPFPPSTEAMTMIRRIDVSAELLENVYETIFGSEFKKRSSAKDFINFRLNDPSPQPADAYLNQLRACEAFDLGDVVSRISQPAFIVVGTDDHLIPPENSKWLNEQIKGSKLYVIKNVGHMVPLEAAEDLAQILIENKL